MGGKAARQRLDDRKAAGRHYTPPALAAFLATCALRPFGTSAPAAVLDPACGDGALLAAVRDAVGATGTSAPPLLGYDRDAAALLQAARRLETPRLVHADFLDAVFAGGPAPVLPPGALAIANPPYVRVQRLDPGAARRLRQLGLEGRVDLAHAFVPALARVLPPGGVLALLTSNRFLSTQAGRSVRRLLAQDFLIDEVIDLGDTRPFAAAVLPAIVIARRRPAAGPAIRAFVRVYAARATAKAPARTSILDALAAGITGPVCAGGRTFLVERGRQAGDPGGRDPWHVVTPRAGAFLARVAARTAARLGDALRVRVGVKTTADAVFVRADWDRLPARERPEPALLRPLLTHVEAAPFTAAAAPARRILYPYEPGPGRRPVDLAAYPRAAAWLTRHRARLAGRRYVIAAGRRWYEPWVAHDPAAWAAQKLVFPDIAERPRFFLDRSGAVVHGDCYWAALPPAQDDHLARVVLGIANSSLAVTYYDAVCGNRLYAGRRRFITQYVTRFPLPAPGAAPARALGAAVAERLALAAGDPGTAGLEQRIDDLAWRCFHLDRASWSDA